MSGENATVVADGWASIAAVQAWNAANRPGLPVLYWPDGNRGGASQAAITVSTAFVLNGNGEAVVRLNESRWVPLAHIDVHPLAARLADLSDAAPTELDFPTPPCSMCIGVDTYHNGDGFTCPECLTRWSGNGCEGVRPCVECGNEADVLGKDDQPRCSLCQVLVLSGDLEPTEPYTCKRCRTRVTGMGHDSPARPHQLCGCCHQQEARAAELDRILGRAK